MIKPDKAAGPHAIDPELAQPTAESDEILLEIKPEFVQLAAVPFDPADASSPVAG